MAEHDRIDFFARTSGRCSARTSLWGYYHELFHAHPERTAMPWADFEAELAARAVGRRQGSTSSWRAAVPDRADRFDVAALDRPLAGLRFATADDLQQHVRTHIEADRARRADPAFSADLGAFYALLVGFGQVVQVARLGPDRRRAPWPRT